MEGAALPSLPRGEARDIELLGTWRQREDGIAYEVTLPPAGLVWGTDRTAAVTYHFHDWIDVERLSKDDMAHAGAGRA